MKRFSPAIAPAIASRVFGLVVGLLVATTAATAIAAPTTTQASDAVGHPVPAAVVAERIRALNPGTRVDSVSASQLPGLYEVVMGKNIAYVEPSGRYALFGHVWDMQDRRDLTADRKAALDTIDVTTLPRDLAVRQVRGAGTRTLYVFADPQCGYCKALEQTLATMDDITVHTFVMPLLGAESRRLAAAIQCAADPGAAWSALMLKAQLPPDAGSACDSKVDAIAKLAQTLGISGTPTLVAADGRKSAGAMPAAQLVAWLAVPQQADGRLASSGASAGAGVKATAKTVSR